MKLTNSKSHFKKLKSQIKKVIEQTKQQQALEAEQAQVEYNRVELDTWQAKRLKKDLKAELELLKDARGRVSKIWDVLSTTM